MASVSTHRLITPTRFALLVGGVLAPFAMGLSLALFPVGGALLVYALASGIFAYRQPAQSWQWGLWVAGGFLLASFLALIVGIVAGLFAGDEITAVFGGGFLKATLVFGLGPAVIGGCLGGMSGSLLAHKRYTLAAGVFAALSVTAGILPFIG